MEDTFEAFKTELFGKWRKRLSKMCIMVCAVVTISEIGIYIFFLINGNVKPGDIQYLALRIITPTCLNILALLGEIAIVNSSRFSERAKNYAITYSLFVICAVVAIFHNYFNFLLVVVTLPIYLSSVFADKKLMKSIFISTIPAVAVAMAVMFIDKQGPDPEYRVTTLICCVIYVVITYIVSMAHLKTQEEQINYIYKSYKRQSDLIEKLRIEPLTHLYNRAALDEAIKACVENYKLTRNAPIIALIDLDHFKSINDNYGHSSGDEVLMTLSTIIQNNLGGSRNAFRFGGEEFIIIFDKSSDYDCFRTIESIKSDFFNHSYTFAPGMHFTLSAGIVKYREGWTTYDWFDNVDEAMYTSKHDGRNRITVK